MKVNLITITTVKQLNANQRSLSSIVKLMFALVLLFVSANLFAADLEDISFASLPGDNIEITFTMSGTFTAPASFTVDEPARIALDFSDTKSKLSWRTRRIGMGNVKSIAAIEAEARTRIIINLVKQANYKSRISNNKFILTLGSGATEAAPSISQSGTNAFPVAKQKSIKNIDFRRGDGGEGRVVITLSQADIIADIREEGGRVIVDFMDTKLPLDMQQSLDVMDFATPVKSIDTFADGDNTRMIIKPIGDFEHLAYQSDDTLTIDIKPLSSAQKSQAKKAQYTGEKLSLNFQDIEVRAVLQLLADFTGLNVVVSDTVQGSITLRLKNTPWDQALDIILKTKGLLLLIF